MRAEVAIVGVGRTPYSRAKPGEPRLTADEYIAWAADVALQQAGMGRNDFDAQGLGVSHAEVARCKPEDLFIGKRVQVFFEAINDAAGTPEFRPL